MVQSLLYTNATGPQVLAAGKDSPHGRMAIFRAWQKAKAARQQERLRRADAMAKLAFSMLSSGVPETDISAHLEGNGFPPGEIEQVVRAEISFFNKIRPAFEDLRSGARLCGKRFSGTSALSYLLSLNEYGKASMLVKLAGKRANTELEVDFQDPSGRTALHLCAAGGPADLMKLILSIKPSLESKTKDMPLPFGAAEAGGRTPLHIAASRGNAGAVIALLEVKADANAKDFCGNSPYHLCVLAGNGLASSKLITSALEAAGDVSMQALRGEDLEKWTKDKKILDQRATLQRMRDARVSEVKRRVAELRGAVKSKKEKKNVKKIVKKVVVVPGSGAQIHAMLANWYYWLAKVRTCAHPDLFWGAFLISDLFFRQELKKRGIACELPWDGMPEPSKCREHVWKKFILESMVGNVVSSNVVLVGHSTGADAVLRLAEQVPFAGLVVCASGQLDKKLRPSLTRKENVEYGYYDRPWNWKVRFILFISLFFRPS